MDWTELIYQQGKSEGFDSCNRSSNLTQLLIQIIDSLAHMTLKLDGWPWKTIGHLFYATSSFVHHYVAIGQFTLEQQSGYN